MKRILEITLTLFISVNCFGQIETITDSRDNKIYRTIEFQGKNWMIDNLDYETKNSMELDSLETMSLKISGRYYPFYETDSICPIGWSLPNRNDWSNYFRYVYDSLKVESRIKKNKKRHPAVIHMFVESEELDLFFENNPIELKPNYMIEGGILKNISQAANYWTTNIDEEYKDKSHVHISKKTLTVHSHKGHIERKKPKKMRRFMVRCVSKKNKD